MAILRITLDSWRDLGEPADSDGVAGSPLTGRATMTPSLDGGGVLTSDAYHSRLAEQVSISELPWSYDLVDPTHAMPTGWGWTVALVPDGFAARPSFAVLAPEAIAAAPAVDGVRTIRLEDHVGLADTLGTGGLVQPASPDAIRAAVDAALEDRPAGGGLMVEDLGDGTLELTGGGVVADLGDGTLRIGG